MLKEKFYPLWEEDGAGGAGSEEQVDAGTNGEKSSEESPKPMSFDDFLKEGKNQAEFDRRLGQAIETRLANEKARLEAIHNEQLNEMERMSKMTEEERQAFLSQKKDKEIAAREAAITKRELSATAKDSLASKGLPIDLAGIVDYSSEEACNNSIATIEETFRSAVEKAVDEKLKGSAPPKDASTEGSKSGKADEVEAQIKQFMGVK